MLHLVQDIAGTALSPADFATESGEEEETEAVHQLGLDQRRRVAKEDEGLDRNFCAGLYEEGNVHYSLAE